MGDLTSRMVIGTPPPAPLAEPVREQLMQGAQHAADARWQLYEQMAGVHRVVTEDGQNPPAPAPAPTTTPESAS